VASGSGTSVSITPPSTASGATKNQQDITCTFSNARKSVSATVTLRKTWVGALVGDTVNFTGTGLTALASTADTTSETDTGITETMPTGSVITLAENFTTGSAANYTSSLACTGTTGLSGHVLTIGVLDTVIVCTQTNTRSTATTVTLRKQWSGATLNDAVNLTATGLNPFASVADTANKLDTASPQVVNAGNIITLGETFTTGSASNYTRSLACTGTSGLVGNILTVGYSDIAIVCTQTNVRKMATIMLRKQWLGASIGDAVTLSGTGLTSLSSVANTANGMDTGAVQTVNTGSVITITEIFSTGSAANYASSLSCTGTSGLIGNVLTVGSSDTAIVCTQTNSRKIATVTLRKTWASAKVGDAVTLTASGLTSLNSTANTANETDTGVVNTVTAGSAISIDEIFTTGLVSNYTTTLACTGTSGLSGNILTVGGLDTNIVCTQTNTRTVFQSPLLQLQKEVRNVTTPSSPIWKTSNTAKPNEVLEYRITYTNTGTAEIDGATLTIDDNVPAYTTFVSGLCETTIDATPTELGTCELVKTLNAQSAVSAVHWTFTPKSPATTSQLPAGGSGFVTYQVQVE
jgi:hypothetical protein